MVFSADYFVNSVDLCIVVIYYDCVVLLVLFDCCFIWFWFGSFGVVCDFG